MFNQRWCGSSLVALLGLVVALSAGLVQAAEAPVPIAEFFAEAAMSRPVLSPSGRSLALQVTGSSGRRELAVLDLETMKDFRVVAAFTDAHVMNVQWVNDERLVFDVRHVDATAFDRFAPGLFAVNRDGAELRTLVGVRQTSRSGLAPNHYLLRVLRDGTADVVVLRIEFRRETGEVTDTTPFRLDTLSGRLTGLALGAPHNTRGWLVDQQGDPKLTVTNQEGQTEVLWRERQGEEWQAIARFPTYDLTGERLDPLEIGPDGQLYLRAARHDDDGTLALYRFDRGQQRREAEPLVAVKGFDFSGKLEFDRTTRRLLGVRYTGDADGTVWFDPAMKALQATVDERLRGTINRIDVPECGCSRWTVISSFSDRQPTLYLLYDREAGTYRRIGARHQGIEPQRMAQRDFQRIVARDGMQFPVHVTRPAGKGPWPMVVLVHGGPWVRGGKWEWAADSQFLASRGYLVVEPEFRGSTGYGSKLFLAGLKQWGLKMQDDVADAARWAITQGLADPKRICIAGASYGGYATLMGLIRDPELYRCGIAWAAVTDINLMYDITWSDAPDDYRQYGMPVLIGDRVKDADQLVATSPLAQAERLRQPLLLAHGRSDQRVPVEHFNRFLEAVRKTNSQVEEVVYPEEGHGFQKPENRFDFWSRVERFLARNLAQPD